MTHNGSIVSHICFFFFSFWYPHIQLLACVPCSTLKTDKCLVIICDDYVCAELPDTIPQYPIYEGNNLFYAVATPCKTGVELVSSVGFEHSFYGRTFSNRN